MRKVQPAESLQLLHAHGLTGREFSTTRYECTTPSYFLLARAGARYAGLSLVAPLLAGENVRALATARSVTNATAGDGCKSSQCHIVGLDQEPSPDSDLASYSYGPVTLM